MSLIVILVFIIILAVLVVIHEFGHFFAAKKNGILVEEFGFGFPPRVFGIKIGETLYSINLLPIGGFVKVYGEEYHEGEKIDPSLKNRTFISKKPWQKALVVVAGVIMNFILGWVLMTALFMYGVPTATGRVLVETVTPNSPAAAIGLAKNDAILKITENNNVYKITSSKDLISTLQKYGDKQVSLEYKTTKGQTQSALVTPRKNPPKGEGSLGVSIAEETKVKQYSIIEAPFYGLKHAYEITVLMVGGIFDSIGKLASGNGKSVEVTGPVGIAQYTGKALSYGPSAVLELMAVLSLNLAIVNILPFPALDGGRLVFIVYEWITKRRVNQTFEQYLNLAGFVVLIGLTLVITARDLSKLQFVQSLGASLMHLFNR